MPRKTKSGDESATAPCPGVTHVRSFGTPAQNILPVPDLIAFPFQSTQSDVDQDEVYGYSTFGH